MGVCMWSWSSSSSEAAEAAKRRPFMTSLWQDKERRSQGVRCGQLRAVQVARGRDQARMVRPRIMEHWWMTTDDA